MNNRTLKKAITELGGVSIAATELGVSRQCVYLWLKRGPSRYGIMLIEKALKDKRSRAKN